MTTLALSSQDTNVIEMKSQIVYEMSWIVYVTLPDWKYYHNKIAESKWFTS